MSGPGDQRRHDQPHDRRSPIAGWTGSGDRAAPVLDAAEAAAAEAAVEALPADAPIRLERVSRWYGSVVAVNEVTFAVGPGVTGLLGPNGAGKSTLLGMIAGLLRPSAGRVTLLGHAAWRNPSVYARVGLVPEREAVPAYLTGFEFARLAATLQGLPDPDDAARRAIATVDLDAAAGRSIGTYSKGMRQRAKLAAALVHDPPVLLLDEPFNGMDPRQRLHMMALLRSMAAEGRTILFSSHILEEVERLAERVLVVYAGRLAASGDFREIRRLMTDRPHTFTIRSSDDRRLAGRLMGESAVFGVELSDALAGRADGRLRGLHPPAATGRPRRRGVALRGAARRRIARAGVRVPGAPMIATIAMVTLRALLSRRRALLMLLLVAAAGRHRAAGEAARAARGSRRADGEPARDDGRAHGAAARGAGVRDRGHRRRAR